MPQKEIYRCTNPECETNDSGVTSRECYYVNPGETPKCPKCKSSEAVRLACVHALIRDDKKGPIKGEKGRAWKVACQPNNRKLPTHCSEFVATEHGIITCPDCIEALKKPNAVDEESQYEPSPSAQSLLNNG